ncbi:Protein of unknown function [Gryllus bimaculatus]|nr:Protein of unknown function [Gryllus bimaculatus]
MLRIIANGTLAFGGRVCIRSTTALPRPGAGAFLTDSEFQIDMQDKRRHAFQPLSTRLTPVRGRSEGMNWKYDILGEWVSLAPDCLSTPAVWDSHIPGDVTASEDPLFIFKEQIFDVLK